MVKLHLKKFCRVKTAVPFTIMAIIVMAVYLLISNALIVIKADIQQQEIFKEWFKETKLMVLGDGKDNGMVMLLDP